LDAYSQGIGVPRKIENRDAWLRERLANTDEAPLLSNGNENWPAALAAMIWRGLLAGRDCWNVTFETMATTCDPDCTFRLTLELGDALHAYAGSATPPGPTAGLIRDQFIHRGMEHEHNPPYDLPTLHEPHLYLDPDVPQALDWITYWSRRGAELMAYSEADHAHVFARHARGRLGSLVFQATAEPLDLSSAAVARP
jgi:hypothetical protein